jgi:hypothetical protein
MRHTQQYRAFGNNTEDYFRAYLFYIGKGLGANAYKNNPFEVDARVFGNCMYDLIDSQPELERSLGEKKEELRNVYVCCLTDENWTKYKGIVDKCLGAAKRADTTFWIVEDVRDWWDIYPVYGMTAV